MSFVSFLKRFFKLVIYLLAFMMAVIIVLAIYMYVVDPFNIKQYLIEENTEASVTTTDQVSESTYNKHPLLTEEQEKTLGSIGVDVSSLPSEITPEMEDCFRKELGNERVEEIIKTGKPSTIDLIKAGSCL